MLRESTPLLIILSAPSGGGKTTLCSQLLAKHADISRAVTCTTRAPRAEEQHGTDYYFLDQATFASHVSNGHFLEYANVYDNRYGVLESEVVDRLNRGHHVLLNIDVQGASTVRREAAARPSLSRRVVSVFLTPPSLSALKERLLKRASESPESLARRLQEASLELSHWSAFDYLIISTTIAEDLRRMEVILEAEMMRQNRSKPPSF